jgi:RNA polymerase sigma factor (sigma-70 family)
MGLGSRKEMLLGQIRRIAARQRLNQLSDRELLGRFASQGDEEAFRSLIERYGPLVLRVCQRVLGHDHDAEDACQATFVVLASKAGTRAWSESIAGWLQAVAVRVARQARRAARRRRNHEDQAASKTGLNPAAEVSVRELHQLLEEELAHLPEAYRTPLVQHYLVGQGQEEIARQLGWSLRTLTRRLEQGRLLLQKRLAARGATVTGVLLAVLLAEGARASAMPAALAASTLHAVMMFKSGQAIAGGSLAVTALAAATLQGMTTSRLKIAALMAAAVLLAAVGAAAAWLAKSPERAVALPPPVSQVNQQPVLDNDKPDAGSPTVVFSGRVVDASGKPVPQAEVTALARRPFRAGDHGLRENTLAFGLTDSEGRFRLTVPADFPSWYPDRQVVLVAKKDGALTTLPVSTLSGQVNTPLRLGASGMIRGRLVDTSGALAAGVRVQVVRLGDAAWEPVQGEDSRPPPFWPEPATSNEKGEFILPGLDASQNVWLQFQDDRYELTTVAVSPSEHVPALFRLGPPRLLRGQVLDEETGRPLPFARLAVFAGEWQEMHHERYTALTATQRATRTVRSDALDGRADAEGRFKLRLPGASAYRVDVFPPREGKYLALTRTLRWSEGTTGREEEFRLPPAVELRGQVLEGTDGKPVAGAVAYFQSISKDNPHYRTDVLCDRSTMATSAADGSFRLAVPPGPGALFVYGPRWEYVSQVVDPGSLVPGPRRPLRSYVDGLVRVDVSPSAKRQEVKVTLQRGVAVPGRVTDADGSPVREFVMVCSGKVVPLRNRVVAPLPAFGGEFLLPGCDPLRTYPVLFLDARNKQGTLVEVQGNAGAFVRLEPCGTASVRVLRPDGLPATGCRLELEMFLQPDSPLEDDFALAVRGLLADPYSATWVDPLNYGKPLTTDEDGKVTLPALVPGVRYRVAARWGGFWMIQRPFAVRAGESLTLPDLRLRDFRFKS